jgi:hypothetical protein
MGSYPNPTYVYFRLLWRPIVGGGEKLLGLRGTAGTLRRLLPHLPLAW